MLNPAQFGEPQGPPKPKGPSLPKGPTQPSVGHASFPKPAARPAPPNPFEQRVRRVGSGMRRL